MLQDGVNHLGRGPAGQGDAQLCLGQAHRRQGDENAEDSHGLFLVGGAGRCCSSLCDGGREKARESLGDNHRHHGKRRRYGAPANDAAVRGARLCVCCVLCLQEGWV